MFIPREHLLRILSTSKILHLNIKQIRQTTQKNIILARFVHYTQTDRPYKQGDTMIKRLKHSVILLAAILLIVPATVSISQTTDMEEINITLNVIPSSDKENPKSQLRAGTTALPIGTADQTPVAMIIIGIGLITVAGFMRRRQEKTIPVDNSTAKKNYQSEYDRPILFRG